VENPLKRFSTALLMLGLALSNSAVNAGNKQETVNPYQLNIAGQTDYKLVSTQSKLRAQPLPQPPLPEQLQAKPFAKEIESAARASELDPILVHALIHVESRHHHEALSNKGAVGLMQVLPETALRFGVSNPGKPEQNLLAGTRYLRSLLDMFDQRVDLALAAYNAGEGAVIKYKREIPPYPETQHYVPSVLEKYEEWRPPKRKLLTNYLPGTVLDAKAVAKARPAAIDYPPARPAINAGEKVVVIDNAEPEKPLLLESVLDKAECFEPCPGGEISR
jgi:hypothetical protein